MGIRQKLWERIATDLKPKNLSSFVYKEVSLQQLPEELPKILEGGITGRMIVAVE